MHYETVLFLPLSYQISILLYYKKMFYAINLYVIDRGIFVRMYYSSSDFDLY